MFNRDQSEDYRPLFWVSGHPIYVNKLILILNIAAFALVRLRILEDGFAVFAVHLRDEIQADFLGADRFARSCDCAIPEAGLVHLLDHFQYALLAFRFALGQGRQMGNFRGNEKHRGRIFARGDARAATDASGGVHGVISVGLRDGQRIAVRRSARVDRDESTRLDDSVEGAPIRHQIFQHGKSARAPRFNATTCH